MEIKENEHTNEIPETWELKIPYVGDKSPDYIEGFFDGLKQNIKRSNPWRDTQPIPSSPLGGPVTICPKCGVKWEGAMLYSCPNMECPIQPKVIF